MEYNYISPCIPSPNVLYSCPLKSPQNQDLIGFPADSRRRPYTFRYMPRGIRQMSMHAWPLDQKPRENESSVRELPLVKQNFVFDCFIIFYQCPKGPEIQRF